MNCALQDVSKQLATVTDMISDMPSAVLSAVNKVLDELPSEVARVAAAQTRGGISCASAQQQRREDYDALKKATGMALMDLLQVRVMQDSKLILKYAE